MTTLKARDHSIIYLNGIKTEIFGEDNFLMLADWLRKSKGLCGTKIVCAEGDCGACTILKTDPVNKNQPGFIAINSCIILVAQLDGQSLVTVEGLSLQGQMSPIQEAMASSDGSQCGYCTPGFVMAMTGMVEDMTQKGEATPRDRKTCANYLTGNLCRCTGYEPILSAATSISPSTKYSLTPRYYDSKIKKDLLSCSKQSLAITTPTRKFFAPTSLKEALTLLKKHGPILKILGSSTDLGVQYNKGAPMPSVFLSLSHIAELHDLKSNAKSPRITVGSQVTLANLRRQVEPHAPEFVRLLNIFASPQIKNAATLVGNIANASPIGDTIPYLLVSSCLVHVASLAGSTLKKRDIPLDEFYLDYKKLALKPGELITSISFEKESPRLHRRIYKVSARKDLDISAVSAAFSVELSPKTQEIMNPRIALGGVAATPIRLKDIEEKWVGKTFDQTFALRECTTISSRIKPLSDPRGSIAYRKILIENMFAEFAENLIKQSAGTDHHV